MMDDHDSQGDIIMKVMVMAPKPIATICSLSNFLEPMVDVEEPIHSKSQSSMMKGCIELAEVREDGA